MTFFRFINKPIIVQLISPLIVETIPSVMGSYSSAFSTAYNI